MTALADEGNYWGPVIEVGTAEMPNSGTPFLFATCALQYIDVGGQWQQLPQQLERDLLVYLSDAALAGGSTDRLEYLGVADLTNPECKSEFRIKGIGLTCRHDMWDGKQVEKWDITGMARRGRTAINTTQIQRINAAYQQQRGAAASAAAVSPAASAPPPASAPSGDSGQQSVFDAAPASTPPPGPPPTDSGDEVPF